jgi:hypothetical protein
MIASIARLSLAALMTLAIGITPVSVMAADPAPAAAPMNKTAEKQATKQVKKDKKSGKQAKKKSKKKSKSELQPKAP